MVSPGSSRETQHPKFSLVAGHVGTLCLARRQNSRLPEEKQNVEHKPHCLCKQFRHILTSERTVEALETQVLRSQLGKQIFMNGSQGSYVSSAMQSNKYKGAEMLSEHMLMIS